MGLTNRRRPVQRAIQTDKLAASPTTARRVRNWCLFGRLFRSPSLRVKDVELLVLAHELEVLRRQVARRKGSTRLTGPCWQLLPPTCRAPRGMFSWSRQRTLLRWHQAMVPPNWPQPRRPGWSAAVADGRTGVGAAACTAEPALGHRRICGELAKLGSVPRRESAARSLLAAWGRRRLAPARGSCPYLIAALRSDTCRERIEPTSDSGSVCSHDTHRLSRSSGETRLRTRHAPPREPGVESPHPQGSELRTRHSRDVYLRKRLRHALARRPRSGCGERVRPGDG
jgi:hypothetical protein